MIQIDLTGRRALVTGASSGLGRAIALSLGAAGARVGVHYRADRSTAEAVVSEISQAAGSSAAFGADVGDPSQLERMFADVEAQFGGLDILVNNAGMDGPRSACVDSDPVHWQRVITVDLQGSYYCTREALKRMLPQRRGVIRTPINADVWGHPDSLRDLDQKIAMARPGEPEEIGRVAAFLVSDLASYITGTTLAVDGGMLIYPDFSHGG